MDRPARLPLTPRLVLIFAVLACVFGWGHTVAEAAGTAAPPAQVAVVGTGSGAPMVGHAVPGVEAIEHDQAAPRQAGHGDAGHSDAGHGASHDHSVTCMASSATTAFGVVAAPDVAALVVTAVPALTRARESVTPLVEHRAPSIATLCVQRT